METMFCYDPTDHETVDEAVLRIVSFKLNRFFQSATQSPEELISIFQTYFPTLSTINAVILLFSKGITKPTLIRLLDRTVRFLSLDQQETVDASLKNSNLLHQTIMKNCPNLFRLILKASPHPNTVLVDLKTPISIAVVTSHIEPATRLEYVRTLLMCGADPLIPDANFISPFQRLCGMDSNYPLVYTYYRDYLLTHCPPHVQNELNGGLENAVSNGCLLTAIDLLQHGAILTPLTHERTMFDFLKRIRSMMLYERRSINLVDPLLLCFTEMLRYNIPCADSSYFIEEFLQLIYIPAVCFPTNNDPRVHPSLINVVKFLQSSFFYGYLTKTTAAHIRDHILPRIINLPIQNGSVTPQMRQEIYNRLDGLFRESIRDYYQRPISLKTISIRLIRQTISKIHPNTIKQLNISTYLKNIILPTM